MNEKMWVGMKQGFPEDKMLLHTAWLAYSGPDPGRLVGVTAYAHQDLHLLHAK